MTNPAERSTQSTILAKSLPIVKQDTHYSKKTCCALAWAARRLRQYMLNHTTFLISKMDPIKYVFEKPALSGRIARWQMILTEYDIQYTSQKAIKGSVVV